MIWTQVLAFVGITGIIALLGVIFAAGKYITLLNGLVKQCGECPITNVAADVRIIKREQEIIWRTLTQNLADIMRQHYSPELDQLVDRLNAGNIDLGEARQLFTLLRNEIVESRALVPVPKAEMIGCALMLTHVMLIIDILERQG